MKKSRGLGNLNTNASAELKRSLVSINRSIRNKSETGSEWAFTLDTTTPRDFDADRR